MRHLLSALLFAALVTPCAATTVRYVNLYNSAPATPYTNWTTAATSIQDALTPALAGDLILVADGVYSSGTQSNSGLNRVNINKAVTVKSLDGPPYTVIQGLQLPGSINGVNAVRCVSLASNATLSGFTLTGGATQAQDAGGGVKCDSTNSIVTNCVISGNWSGAGGGGVYSGTVIGCSIVGNVTVVHGGGGVASSIVKNSVLTGNLAKSLVSGTGGAADAGSLTNCLIYNNTCGYNGGATSGSTLINCTVANNISYGTDGPVSGGVAINSIIYYNLARTNVPASGSGRFTNCCVVPAPSGGANIITNPPLFLNPAGLDFHLSAASLCINAGNNTYVASATDLEGLPRVVNSLVDLGAYEFQSTIHYVVTNKHATPVYPYTSWAWATTNLQDAADAALPGEFVVVSNGVYKTGGRAVYGLATNRLTIEGAVTVESVNGPAATTIAGLTPKGSSPSGVRCAYLASGSALIGFTLTNGCTRASGNAVAEESGGGIWCEDNSAVVSNCFIVGNLAADWGGGAFRGTLISCVLSNNDAAFGGGAASNVLVGCTLVQNTNSNDGAGAYYSMLTGCVLTRNRGVGNSSTGGGVSFSDLNGCVVYGNSAGRGGGIAYGTAVNSQIVSNQATSYGGGCYSSVMNDCILRGNSASDGGGARDGTLNNCTLVGNKATVAGGGSFSGNLNNCIIQFNSSPGGSNYSAGLLNYCCTTPLPPAGWGNITNDPALVSVAGTDFHLQGTSPCINSGNNGSVTTSVDLDGAPRIIAATVDIGAYEYQYPGSVISYAYLEQYGLATDGSADYVDSDGDGMNNWMEWQAGTIPISKKSVLKIGSIQPGPVGVLVTWQSVTNRLYFVQRATALDAPTLFQTITGTLQGQLTSTSWLDTNAIGAGPFFYRVGALQGGN